MAKYGYLVAAVGLGMSLAALSEPQAQTADFSGKQLRIVVGYSAGTGYDRWGRLIARHIGRQLPGAKSAIVVNMPGAGSISATSHLYNKAAKDGTEFGLIGRDVITLPLMKRELASRFDATQFGWLGSPTTETNVCVANAAAGLKTGKDLLSKELVVGATGAGTGTSIYPNVLNAILGTKFKIVDGYKGSNAVLLAMERGEVEGICQSYSHVGRKKAEEIKSGKVVILLQGGGRPNPKLQGIPFAPDELTSTKEQRQALRFLYGSQAYARPVVVPPGVPDNVLKTLQNAFDAMLKDAKFVAEASKLKLRLDPVSGEEVRKLVMEAYSTPEPVIARLKKAMEAR